MKLGVIFYVKGRVDRSVFAAEAEFQPGRPVDVELVKHGYGREVPFKLDGKWVKQVQLQGRSGHGAVPFTYLDAGTDEK